MLVFCASCAVAQELSYDGNRWYDVEVVIFTHDLPAGTGAEIPVAHKLTAAYLPRLRELQTRASAFAIEFPQDQPPAPAVAPDLLPPLAPAGPVIVMGPVYSPALRDGFKLMDFDRDPFIDLGTRAAQFGGMARNIDAADDHRLLWHKVWRQPVQARGQTSAVFVSGGDTFATHTELEGSLRLSDNAGGVMLDINVWLNGFMVVPTMNGALATNSMPPLNATAPGALVAPAAPAAGLVSEWKIPEFPFPPPVSDIEPVPAELVQVWQLAQTRELGAGQLYYLDHPALGVLIEIRPYLLPERIVINDDEDF
jgi:hypothetical protein